MHSQGSSREDGPDDSRDPAAGDREGGTRVFRIPVTAYAAVACLTAIVLVPVLNWPARTGWLLIVPIALLWWVARVRTVVGRTGLAVRTVASRREMPWNDVRGIVFPHPRVFGISWARAHLSGGAVVRLPAVTWGDIPRVSEASGGRLPDPVVPRDRARTERVTEAPEDTRDSEDAGDTGDMGDAGGSEAPGPEDPGAPGPHGASSRPRH